MKIPQSRIDMLREEIEYTVKELGPDALILQDLTAELSRLELKQQGVVRENPVTLGKRR